MDLPEDFKSALHRRHYGKKHTLQEIDNTYKILCKHLSKYVKYKQQLDHLLNCQWEEWKVEKYFDQPIWHHAHKKLKEYERLMKKQHKAMFKLLTEFDGNPNQDFDNWVISPYDIRHDFETKYMNIPDII